MRYLLILAALLMVGCPPKQDQPRPPSEAELPAIAQPEKYGEYWTGHAPPHVIGSPFLPALARAGFWPLEYPRVIREVNYHGTIRVEDADYHVLFIASHLILTASNLRGSSFWLICDSEMNPVWDNPDWGGTPGDCFDNHVRVNLHDKFFEIRESHDYGDFLTFRRDGDRLVAAIEWESDETRIAQFINWPRWRRISNEPDERVTQILPVAGHPNWRIVLTDYKYMSHQGSAILVDISASGEFGLREIDGMFSAQTSVPESAGTIRPVWSPWTFAWIDWNCRGSLYRAVGIIYGEDWIEFGTSRR